MLILLSFYKSFSFFLFRFSSQYPKIEGHLQRVIGLVYGQAFIFDLLARYLDR